MFSFSYKCSLFLWLCFFTLSCGGGGSSIIATGKVSKADLIGAYSLNDFKVTYNNGQIFSTTTEGLDTYFGSLKLNTDDTFSQFIQADEKVIYSSGTYTLNEKDELIISSNGVSTTLALTLDGSSLTTKADEKATAQNSAYTEDNTWLKISSEEPPSLSINDVNGTYTLAKFYVNSKGTEYHPANTPSFSGSMSIDADGKLNQTITINGTDLILQGNLSLLSSNTYTITSSNGSSSTIKAYYDGTYFVNYLIVTSTGYTEVNIWTKN